jgi:hypothetical protein
MKITAASAATITGTAGCMLIYLAVFVRDEKIVKITKAGVFTVMKHGSVLRFRSDVVQVPCHVHGEQHEGAADASGGDEQDTAVNHDDAAE